MFFEGDYRELCWKNLQKYFFFGLISRGAQYKFNGSMKNFEYKLSSKIFDYIRGDDGKSLCNGNKFKFHRVRKG